MPQYILRDMPSHLWEPFKARALREGWTLRQLLHQLMRDYADGRISPSEQPQPLPMAGEGTYTCPQGHITRQPFTREETRQLLASGQRNWTCATCGERFPIAQEERDNMEAWLHAPVTPPRTKHESRSAHLARPLEKSAARPEHAELSDKHAGFIVARPADRTTEVGSARLLQHPRQRHLPDHLPVRGRQCLRRQHRKFPRPQAKLTAAARI